MAGLDAATQSHPHSSLHLWPWTAASEGGDDVLDGAHRSYRLSSSPCAMTFFIRLAEVLPVKAKKLARPSRYGIAFLVQREAVLLRERPEAGLLGGMLEVPSTPWLDALPAKKEALRSAPVNVPGCRWRELAACVHALPSRAERLPRAGAGRRELHALGRAGALPLGPPARPTRRKRCRA